jgi:hypothetical protein
MAQCRIEYGVSALPHVVVLNLAKVFEFLAAHKKTATPASK